MSLAEVGKGRPPPQGTLRSLASSRERVRDPTRYGSGTNELGLHKNYGTYLFGFSRTRRSLETWSEVQYLRPSFSRDTDRDAVAGSFLKVRS